MNIENVKALAEVLKANGLTKLEVCEGETKILLEKEASAVPVYAGDSPAMQTVTTAMPSEKTEVLDFNHIKEVKSPIVGVFYAASAPDAEPFVVMGSKVKKGDVLCIVEAMKLMNEITAETDGEIVDICVKNDDIVEFGQVLFKIY